MRDILFEIVEYMKEGISENKMKILLEIIDANLRPRILKITKKKITQMNCKKYLIFFI